MIDLRSKEVNCSMPSGDAAQGSCFAFFMCYYFPYFYTSLGATTFLIKFIALVSVGRVFHHCHYFGDTVAGAFLGFMSVLIINSLGLVVPVPQDIDN